MVTMVRRRMKQMICCHYLLMTVDIYLLKMVKKLKRKIFVTQAHDTCLDKNWTSRFVHSACNSWSRYSWYSCAYQKKFHSRDNTSIYVFLHSKTIWINHYSSSPVRDVFTIETKLAILGHIWAWICVSYFQISRDWRRMNLEDFEQRVRGEQKKAISDSAYSVTLT